MMERNHHIPTEAEAALIPPTTSVLLTREGQRRTAALAVARFAVVIATSTLICIVRLVILYLFMEKGLKRHILWISELGRLAMILSQESSVLTYSCAYKGVTTWASPVQFGKIWDGGEQAVFRREVVQFMGRAHHARLVFWVAEQFFKLMGFLFSSWRVEFGPSIFSSFNSLDEESFSSESMQTVWLCVSEKEQMSANWVMLYKVEFKLPDAIIKRLHRNLTADRRGRIAVALLLIFPALCGIVGPFMLIGNGGVANVAIVIFDLMQVAAGMVRYIDCPNRSINCKFEDVAVSPASGRRRDPTTNDRRRPARIDMATMHRGNRSVLDSPGIEMSPIGVHRDSDETPVPVTVDHIAEPLQTLSSSANDGNVKPDDAYRIVKEVWERQGSGEQAFEEKGKQIDSSMVAPVHEASVGGNLSKGNAEGQKPIDILTGLETCGGEGSGSKGS